MSCDMMVIPCMVVLVTSATNTKADGHQRNWSYNFLLGHWKMEREREKKRGARYLDIVLLTFPVGICNAYRLLNRAAYKALDLHVHLTHRSHISEWMWRGESSDRDIPVIESSAWLLDPSPATENFLLRFTTAWQEDSVPVVKQY